MRNSDLKICVSALAIFLAGAANADAQERVVSMNLCTDQLAMMLAGPGQLISISEISSDRYSSVMWEESQKLPKNSGRAEEIYLLEPDLVLANVYSDPMAVSMLRNLGIEVVQFETVESLADIAPQVRRMGRVLGQDERAEEVARDFEIQLNKIVSAEPEQPVAAFFYANGYSLGQGTLSHEVITRAGFQNLSEVLGRTGGGQLSLEDLILNRPDVIVTSSVYEGASRAEEIMSHDALRDIPRVQSSAAWVCGTPHVIEAIEDMRQAREALSD